MPLTASEGGVLPGLAGEVACSPVSGDQQLLRQHLTATVRRCGIAAVAVVAATPLVYTTARLIALKHRASLTDFVMRGGQQHGATVVPVSGTNATHGGDVTPSPLPKVTNENGGHGAVAARTAAATETSSPTVGTVRISYARDEASNKSGGGGGGGHSGSGGNSCGRRGDRAGRSDAHTRIYRFIEGHLEGLQPLAHTIRQNRRTSDSEFARALALTSSTLFASRALLWIVRCLAVDVTVNVGVFSACAVLGAVGRSSTTPLGLQEGTCLLDDTATLARVHIGGCDSSQGNSDTGADASSMSISNALSESIITYFNALADGLAWRRPFFTTNGRSSNCNGAGASSGSADANLTLYGLYDFAFSVSSPFEACCLPAWAAVLRRAFLTLHWPGRPSNPEWVAAEQVSRGSANGGVVATVWRAMTPKGYLAYFVLRAAVPGSFRRGVAVAGRRLAQRLPTTWASALGLPPADIDPADATVTTDEESRLRASRTRQQQHQSSSRSWTAQSGTSTGPTMGSSRATHPDVGVFVLEVCSGLCGYVVVSTLAMLDLMLGETGSTSSLLAFLRRSAGVRFHVTGYLIGVKKVLWFALR